MKDMPAQSAKAYTLRRGEEHSRPGKKWRNCGKRSENHKDKGRHPNGIRTASSGGGITSGTDGPGNKRLKP